MRNRVLHDALRDFALEAASLLTDDLRDGAEVEFDVIEDGVAGRGAPVLYRYRPRVEAFIGERWGRLRELPACARAADALGAGATTWLRVNGLRGEQAEPALRAMLERLYEDATSFGFPEERFDRIYREVEVTLYHDAVRACVVAPLRGAAMAAERVDLGGGLSLVRGDLADAPPEAVWPDPLEAGAGSEPAVLCVLERDAPPGEGISAAEAAERFAAVVTALRLWAPGAVGVGAPGWRRADEGRWQPLPLGLGGDVGAGATWFLPAGEEAGLSEFFAAVDAADPPRTVAWALARFEMGSARGRDAEALSDYLLALRALLDATSDAGEASLALRVAALCAEEGRRRLVQRRVEAAIGLERDVMGGAALVRAGDDSPRDLVAEVEAHLRALLRDVLCGYLDPNLKGVADDILLEATPEPFMEIRARDLRAEAPRREPSPHRAEVPPRSGEVPLRREPRPRRQPSPPPPEPDRDTSELRAVEAAPAPEPVPEPAPLQQARLEGVTASADWAWDDPEDYSAPV
jgi:hypothetical protein